MSWCHWAPKPRQRRTMARIEGVGYLDIRDLVAQAAEIAVNARREGVALATAAR